MATVDVVEPLGSPRDGRGEVSRIGRVEMSIPVNRILRRNTLYRILYQDLGARWHETTFRFDDEHQVTVRQLGPLGRLATDQLPGDVLDGAQLVHDAE